MVDSVLVGTLAIILRHSKNANGTADLLVNKKEERKTKKDTNAKSEKPYQVAIHVRRGDVNVCSERYLGRYLPNSYFLDIFDTYLPKNITSPNVTVYSEKVTPHEGFGAFEERGFHRCWVGV